MKARSRPFACVIAGKTVTIALRRGGGLMEPSKVYVRCDERDCQYVDFNTAPCPLRVEMFTNGSDRRVAEYLSAHAGRRFCYACLTLALEFTHDQIRRASWALIADPTFSIGPSRCIECRKRRMTIGFAERGASEVGGAAVVTTEVRPSDQRVIDFLRESPDVPFCATCIAFACDLALSAAKAVFADLGSSGFEWSDAACSVCSRWQRVVWSPRSPSS